jgi:hypothetical protein
MSRTPLALKKVRFIVDMFQKVSVFACFDLEIHVNVKENI